MKMKHLGTIGVVSFHCLALSGCLGLQIGGKTYHCPNPKEADARIAQLESRIRTLEQYAGITPPQPIAVASATVEAK